MPNEAKKTEPPAPKELKSRKLSDSIRIACTVVLLPGAFFLGGVYELIWGNPSAGMWLLLMFSIFFGWPLLSMWTGEQRTREVYAALEKAALLLRPIIEPVSSLVSATLAVVFTLGAFAFFYEVISLAAGAFSVSTLLLIVILVLLLKMRR